jgi:hypothetical protein
MVESLFVDLEQTRFYDLFQGEDVAGLRGFIASTVYAYQIILFGYVPRLAKMKKSGFPLQLPQKWWFRRPGPLACLSKTKL